MGTISRPTAAIDPISSAEAIETPISLELVNAAAVTPSHDRWTQDDGGIWPFRAPPDAQGVIVVPQSRPPLPPSAPADGSNSNNPCQESAGITLPAEAADDRQDIPDLGVGGRDSAASFLRQAFSLLESRHHLMGRPQAKGAEHQNPTRMNSLDVENPLHDENYVLPIRQTADNLMEIYWTEVWPLFPFVHRPSFEKQYLELWTGNSSGATSPTRIFHCLMNTIFALAAQMSSASSPEAREASSMAYFARSRKLLQFDVLETSTIETAQALLMMALYLQSTSNPSRCSVVVGMAVRTMEEVALHRERLHTPQTQYDREMFRRLWHGCSLISR